MNERNISRAETPAVLIQNAFKSYGDKPVLKDLSMHVPIGKIYGLLGSSGCGKTTLLSCVVGARDLDSGDVFVLGGRPGTVGSGVPGPKVGYMPQEIALVGEFTVQDAIYYFGRIFEMKDSMIAERFDELTTLLDLPDRNRYVKNCSGGQQRRISLAASMIHLPDLLILDEPTVGVDPILRERIWDYLVDVTSKTKISVIITTHYIEEARQANVIGLMRDGYLLAEESPSRLLTMFNTTLLEEVFFTLSQKQNEGKLTEMGLVNTSNTANSCSVSTINTTQGSTDALAVEEVKKPKKEKKMSNYQVKSKRLKALLDKNFKQIYRNIGGVIFILMFPIVQNVFFMLSIGPDIQDINVGIVNEESMTTSCPNFTKTGTALPYDFSSCHFRNLSCRFLDYLDVPMLVKVRYESVTDAIDAAKHGEVAGVIFMAKNFTSSLEGRIEDGRKASEEVLSFSEVKVWMDMSNRQIGGIIKVKLIELFTDFQKDLMADCNVSTRITDIANINYMYGDQNDSYTEFVTPGLILTLMFFMMTLMTSQIIITDRFEGVWDRSIIAGVSAVEILLTHFVVQLIIVVIYTAQVIVITFAIFGINIAGSTWIILLLTFLQGIAGCGYGFLISVISPNISMSNILATGTFYIMILICGLMWPLQGMPISLQWFSKCMPFTVPIESFRNVMKRGWDFTEVEVFNGVAIEVAWIIIFSVLNVVLVQSKR